MNKQKNHEFVKDPKTGRITQLTMYKPEYDQRLIEHLSQGFSFASFAALVDVNRDTIYEWAKAHESFRIAKETGRSKSLYFWEKIGIAGTCGKIRGFNAMAWKFNMVNRFKWSNKEDINLTSNKEPINHKSVMEYLESKKF